MVSAMTVELEMGAMIDQAKVVRKPVQTVVSVPDVLDAKLLFTAMSASNLVIYREEGGNYFIATGVGDDVVEMPIYFFDSGKYFIINTNESNGCTELTLEECRAHPDYISEITFSIQASQPSATQSSSLLGGLGELLGF